VRQRPHTGDDVVGKRTPERDVGTVFQDVSQLIRIVRRKTISSSPSEDLTRGSRKSVNFRSFEIPMIDTREFSSSEFIRERL